MKFEDFGHYTKWAYEMIKKNARPRIVIKELYEIVSMRKHELLAAGIKAHTSAESACLEALQWKLFNALDGRQARLEANVAHLKEGQREMVKTFAAGAKVLAVTAKKMDQMAAELEKLNKPRLEPKVAGYRKYAARARARGRKTNKTGCGSKCPDAPWAKAAFRSKN